MRRKLWVLLTALLLVAAIGDTIAWYFAVRQMRDGLADWIAARRAAGWSVNVAAPEPGGWPLAATLTLSDVALRAARPTYRTASTGGLSAWWCASILSVRSCCGSRPRARNTCASPTRPHPYSAGRLRLLVPLQADPSAQALELRGEGPAGQRSGWRRRRRPDARSAGRGCRGEPGRAEGQATVSMSVKADGIGLPTRLNWPLGPRIASVVLNGALTGPLPRRDRADSGRHSVARRGGSLEVQHLQTHWGVLGLTATAKLALDPQLQPTGTGTAQVTGYAETLDALARNGLMSRSAATTAKAVLSLLAVTPVDGGPSEVEVPLSLQYRTLSMQQLPQQYGTG